MNLSEAFILLLLPLIGQCLAFYPVCLSSCDVDVQSSQQRFGGRPGGPKVFDFPFSAQAGYRSLRFHGLFMLLS